MKKVIFVLISILSALLMLSCSGGFYPLLFGEETVDSRAKNHFEAESPSLATGASSRYSFVILTDAHFGSDFAKKHDQEFLNWFEKQLEKEEYLRPRFIISLGDNANDGYESQFKEYKAFADKAISIAKDKLGVSDYKFYGSIGNHDLFHNGYRFWKKYVYPYHTYYSFNVKSDPSSLGFSFYCLDTANGTMGANQLEDFEQRLKKDPAPKIIFTHYPIYANGHLILTTQDDLFIARILTAAAKNNVKHIFEGHTHRADEKDYKLYKETISASFLYDRTATLVTVDESDQSVKTSKISF